MTYNKQVGHQKPIVAKTAFQRMYYDNENWVKLGVYYRDSIPISIDDSTGKFKAEGIMGSMHKCMTQVTLLPLQEDDVASSFKRDHF